MKKLYCIEAAASKLNYYKEKAHHDILHVWDALALFPLTAQVDSEPHNTPSILHQTIHMYLMYKGICRLWS